MNTTMPDRGVYVACLASYNNGILFGDWLDLDQYDDKEEVLEAIKEILSKSPTPGAEEYAIHDYAGLPSAFGEWPDWDKVLACVEGFKKCSSPVMEEAWDIYCKDVVIDFDQFEDCYRGCYDTGAGYAQETMEDCYDLEGLPSIIRLSIDWERVFDDLRYGGDIWQSRGEHGLHIFDNR